MDNKKTHHEKNRFAGLSNYKPELVSAYLSSSDVVEIFNEMVEEIDRLLKKNDELEKFQMDSINNAEKGSWNLVLATLAGTQMNLPKEERDPGIIDLINETKG